MKAKALFIEKVVLFLLLLCGFSLLNTELKAQANAGNDQTICTPHVQLQATDPAPAAGEWSVVIGGNNTVIQDVNNPNTLVDHLQPGQNIFKWTVTDNQNHVSEDYVTITYNYVEALAGFDKEVCGKHTILQAINPNIGTGQWSTVQSNLTITNVNSPNTEVNGLQPGRNILRWTVTNGICVAHDEVIITNNQPSPPIVINDIVVCEPHADIIANEPIIGRGHWEFIAGAGSIENPSHFATRIHNLQPGMNRIRWAVKNGNCEAFDTLKIINNSLYSNAGPDKYVCEKQTTLQASVTSAGEGMGFWTSVNTNSQTIIVNKTLYNTAVILGPGANTFRWNVEKNGCTAFDEVTIFNYAVDAKLPFSDKEICENRFQLIAPQLRDGELGLWTTDNNQVTIENPKNVVTNLNHLQPGVNTFRWHVTKGNCHASDEITIINNGFEIDAGPDIHVCDDKAELIAQHIDNAEGVWEIVQGNATVAARSMHQTHITNLRRGINLFRWVVRKNGCIATDEIKVFNNKPSIPEVFDKEIEICVDTFRLRALKPLFGRGRWNTLGGSAIIDNPTMSETRISRLAKGENLFEWKIQNINCEAATTIRIINKQPAPAIAGKTITVNENFVTLQANHPNTNERGFWTKISGNGDILSPTLFNTKVVNLSDGENVFRWSITNGQCISSDVVTIKYNSSLLVAYAGNDQTVHTDSTKLNARVASNLQGEWSVVSGYGVFNNPNKPDAMVKELSVGENIFQWTVNNGAHSASDVVTIHYKPQKGNLISGKIMAFNCPLCCGIAVLYKLDNQQMKAVRRVRVTNGRFHFNAPDGKYIIQAIPNNIVFDEFHPTYAGNVVAWRNAHVFDVKGNTFDIDIQLVPVHPFALIGQIKGAISFKQDSVYEDSVFNNDWFEHLDNGLTRTENPAKNIPVVLTDTNGNVVAWTLADSQGRYEFQNIPYGEYIVSYEKAGFELHATPVQIDDATPVISDLNIEIAGEDNVVSINQEQFNDGGFNSINLYPNPVRDMLYIQMDFEQDVEYQFEIINSQGKQMYVSQGSKTFGNKTISYNTFDLAPGLYFAKLQFTNREPISLHFMRE